MSDYRVPTKTVGVRLLMDNGQELSGQCFVGLVGPDGHPGRFQDRLNDQRESFLPLRDPAEEELLIHKSGIVWARVDEEVREDDDRDAPASHQVPVRITLAGGIVRLGELRVWQREGNARVVDYLNGGHEFIPLWDAEGLLLIQRRQVLYVRRLDSSPSAFDKNRAAQSS